MPSFSDHSDALRLAETMAPKIDSWERSASLVSAFIVPLVLLSGFQAASLIGRGALMGDPTFAVSAAVALVVAIVASLSIGRFLKNLRQIADKAFVGSAWRLTADAVGDVVETAQGGKKLKLKFPDGVTVWSELSQLKIPRKTAETPYRGEPVSGGGIDGTCL